MTYTVGVDLGTTSARVGLFDEDGRRVGIAREPLAMSVPFAGAAEQDPDEFVAVVRRLLAEIVEVTGVPLSELGSIGITNQRATVVAWDASSGATLRPAIGWQDTRTADVVAELVAQGVPLNTSASCSKMAWMLRSDPDVISAAAAGSLRLGTPDSWLTWALSGGAVHVTDPSNAGATGLYDARSGGWADGALDFFGVPRDALAEVVASDAVVGVTAAEVVGAEIPLAARLGDQMAACAAHEMTEGMAKLTLGTSAMLDVGTGSAAVVPPAGCYTLPLWRRTVKSVAVEEYMIEGSINTAGSVIEWLVRVGVLASVDQLDVVAEQGRAGVGFVPALAGLGSPRQDPAARGVVSGIGLDTTAADLVRGALEGIADRVAELAAHMEVAGDDRVLHVDGGLSRSRVLLEMIGAKTGLRVEAGEPEATLAGIALLAAPG